VVGETTTIPSDFADPVRDMSKNIPRNQPDLARVVELWPVLPPAIRAAVLALVNTSAPTNGNTTPEDDRDQLPPGYERSGKEN